MKMETEASLSERFEAAFNQIHRWLRINMKDVHSDKFGLLLSKSAQRHSIMSRYHDELYQYSKLRNAIVHNKYEPDFYIAEPHKKVVERIEMIAGRLNMPRTALSIATAPVFYYYEDSPLKDVLKILQHFSYSQFPIYHRQEGYKWLLTSDAIVSWMSEHLPENTRDINQVKLVDLFPYKSKKNKQITFVEKSANIFDVEDKFEDFHLKNIKLEAVIITENGKAAEKPLGIVTPWDLVEIDATE